MVSKQAKEQKKKLWKSFYIEVPLEDTTATIEKGLLTIKGPKGENSKTLKYPNVNIEVKGDKVSIGTDKFSKNEKKIIFTYQAHIKNMIKGVKEGFVYNLIIVYEKFPMTIAYKNDTFTVKNLLGEKVPRAIKVPESDGVKVEIKGKDITVSGIDKEKTGQVAANIEQMCRVTNLDRRVVQDGIFITKKPHKEYVL